MKKLKKDLQEENTRLVVDVEKYALRDRYLREEFSKFLDGGSFDVSSAWSTSRKSTMSWEEIFFRMGELKSDAEYSCTLGNLERMRQELDELKHPTPTPKL